MHNQCVQSQVVEMLGSDYTSLLLGTPANRHFTFEPLEVPKSWGGDPAPTKDLLSDNEISCSVDVSHTENLISFSDTNELVMRLSDAYESVDHFHFPLLKISGIPTTADMMVNLGKRTVSSGPSSSADNQPRNIAPRTDSAAQELERQVSELAGNAEASFRDDTRARQLQAVDSASATDDTNMSTGNTSLARPGRDTLEIVGFDMFPPLDESEDSNLPFTHWFLRSYYDDNIEKFADQAPQTAFVTVQDLELYNPYDEYTIFFKYQDGRFQVYEYKMPQDTEEQEEEAEEENEDVDEDEGFDDNEDIPEELRESRRQVMDDFNSVEMQFRQNKAVEEARRIIESYKEEVGRVPPAWFFDSLLIYDDVQKLLERYGIATSGKDKKSQEKKFRAVLTHYGVTDATPFDVRQYVYSIAVTSSILQFLRTINETVKGVQDRTRYATVLEQQLESEAEFRRTLERDIERKATQQFAKTPLYKQLFSKDALRERVNKEGQVMERITAIKEGRITSFARSSALPLKVVDPQKDSRAIQEIKEFLNSITESDYFDNSRTDQQRIVMSWISMNEKLEELEKQAATVRQIALEEMKKNDMNVKAYSELIRQKNAEITIVKKHIDASSSQNKQDVEDHYNIQQALSEIMASGYDMNDEAIEVVRSMEQTLKEINERIHNYKTHQMDLVHKDAELGELIAYQKAGQKLRSANRLASSAQRKPQSNTPRDKKSRDERASVRYQEQQRRKQIFEENMIEDPDEQAAYGEYMDIKSLLDEMVVASKRLAEIEDEAKAEQNVARLRLEEEVENTIPMLIRETNSLRQAVREDGNASIQYMDTHVSEILGLKEEREGQKQQVAEEAEKLKQNREEAEGLRKELVAIDAHIRLNHGTDTSSVEEELKEFKETLAELSEDVRVGELQLQKKQRALDDTKRTISSKIAKIRFFGREAGLKRSDLYLTGNKTPEQLLVKLAAVEESLNEKQQTLAKKYNTIKQPLTSGDARTGVLTEENMLVAAEFHKIFRKLKLDGTSQRKRLKRKLVDYLKMPGYQVFDPAAFMGMKSLEEDTRTEFFDKILKEAIRDSKVEMVGILTESIQQKKDASAERSILRLARALTNTKGAFSDSVTFVAEKYATSADEIVRYAKLGSGRAIHYYRLLQEAVLAVGSAVRGSNNLQENPLEEEEVLRVNWKGISELDIPSCNNVKRIIKGWQSIPSYFGARACDMPEARVVSDMFTRLVFKGSQNPEIAVRYDPELNEVRYGIPVAQGGFVLRSVPIMFVNGNFVFVTDDLEVMWIHNDTIHVTSNTRDKMITWLHNAVSAGTGFREYTVRNQNKLKPQYTFDTIAEDMRYMGAPVRYITDAMMVAHHDWRNEYVFVKETIGAIRREAIHRKDEVSEVAEYLQKKTSMSVETAVEKDLYIPIAGGQVRLRAMMADSERQRRELNARLSYSTNLLNSIGHGATLQQHDELWTQRSGRKPPNESITIQQVTRQFIESSTLRDTSASMQQWIYDPDAIDRAMVSSREFVKIFYPWVEYLIPKMDEAISVKTKWIKTYKGWMRELYKNNFMYHQLDAYNNQALTVVNIPRDRSTPLGPGPTEETRMPNVSNTKYTYKEEAVQVDVRGQLQRFEQPDKEPIPMNLERESDKDLDVVEQMAGLAGIQRVQKEQEMLSMRRKSAYEYSVRSRRRTNLEVDRQYLQSICQKDMQQRVLDASLNLDGGETYEEIQQNPTIFAKWVGLDGTVMQYVGQLSKIPEDMVGDVARYMMGEDQSFRKQFMVGFRYEGDESKVVTIKKVSHDDPSTTRELLYNLDEYARQTEKDMMQVDLTMTNSTFQKDDEDHSEGEEEDLASSAANADIIALDAMMTKLGLDDLRSLRPPGKPRKLGV